MNRQMNLYYHFFQPTDFNKLSFFMEKLTFPTMNDGMNLGCFFEKERNQFI